jgi:hypothetical protein
MSAYRTDITYADELIKGEIKWSVIVKKVDIIFIDVQNVETQLRDINMRKNGCVIFV